MDGVKLDEAICSYIQGKQLASVGPRTSARKFYHGHVVESMESSGSTTEQRSKCHVICELMIHSYPEEACEE